MDMKKHMKNKKFSPLKFLVRIVHFFFFFYIFLLLFCRFYYFFFFLFLFFYFLVKYLVVFLFFRYFCSLFSVKRNEIERTNEPKNKLTELYIFFFFSQLCLCATLCSAHVRHQSFLTRMERAQSIHIQLKMNMKSTRSSL